MLFDPAAKQRQDRIPPHHSLPLRRRGLGATLVAPGHNQVVPLEPEFIVPRDGVEKPDCESRAVRRWLATHGLRHARLRPVYLGDELFSNQPICEAVLAAGGHFLFTCKSTTHPLIQEYLTGVPLPSRTVKVKRGRETFTHRFRWMTGVPLRDSKDALTVNWLEIEIRNPAGKVTYHNSFVTDLPVRRDNVEELAACGRARWKACPREGGDRERDVQHPQDQRVSFGAQLRTWQAAPRVSPGHTQPAGVRLPHGLRSGRGNVACRPGEGRVQGPVR